MALTVTHTYVNPVVDEGADVTGPNEWNATHTIAGSVAASEVTGGAALTKTDDTNVTMTLGGSAATALLAAASMTLGWTGTLAASRGGTGLSALGTGVATWLGTPSSANLAAAVTDETGTGALVFGTSPGFTTAANPVSSDGAALGTTALMWSDLFLASGAVINFNNGDVTLTHSADTLTLAGTDVQFVITGGTVTTSQPVLDLSQTWNDAGVAFTGLKFNVTNTASAAGSLLADLQLGGTTVFNVAPLTNRLQIGSGSTTLQGWHIGNLQSGYSSMWLTNVTPGSTNYIFASDGAQLFTQVSLSHNLRIGTADEVVIDITGLRSVHKLQGMRLITPMNGELTIATGAITVTGGYHRVDTQNDDATDDLDTINDGTDGMILVLRAENSARTVVVKDGTGNIQCAGDMSLDNIQDTITLMYDGTQTAWLELGRGASGA